MTKLSLISYGLIILGVIILVFDVEHYWSSLVPLGCVGCPGFEYNVPNPLTFFEIVFMLGGALAKLLDHEQKKARQEHPFRSDDKEYRTINVLISNQKVLPSANYLSAFKKLSQIMVICAASQIGIALAFFIYDIFFIFAFYLPQLAGAAAAILFSYRPTQKKYSPHYFVLLSSVIPTMSFVWYFVPMMPSIVFQHTEPIDFAFFLHGALPSIWLVCAITYLMKILRFA